MRKPWREATRPDAHLWLHGRRIPVHPHRGPAAGVAEMADAPGLGPGPHWGWRFESSRPHVVSYTGVEMGGGDGHRPLPWSGSNPTRPPCRTAVSATGWCE